MGIMQDAGEILLYIYEQYNKNKWISNKDLVETTKWDGNRLERAINYLDDMGILKIHKAMGNYEGLQNFDIEGLYPEGIRIVEEPKEFKKNFNMTVNLLIFKYSWGASEK